MLHAVPPPEADASIVPLGGLLAGGLEAVQAEWGLDGGDVVLTGRRPFLDVTGRAGFRPDGTLDGSVRMHARLTMLGLDFGEATWAVAGWSPEMTLDSPRVRLRGKTLSVDMAGLPPEASFTAPASLAATVDGTTATVELPGDAITEGEPLSPRYAAVFRDLLGADVSGLSVHRDTAVSGAPGFVSDTDLFFAPGIYGVDSPDALRVLDAAVRAAIAGVFGTVGTSGPEAPAPEPPPPAGETAPAAEQVDVAPPEAPAAADAGASPEASTAPLTAGAEGDARGTEVIADVGTEGAPAVTEAPAESAPPVVEVLMPEAPTEPTPAAAARGAAVAGGAGGAARAARDLPSADADTADARGAVAEPAAETAARAREEVAAELGAAPPPSPEIVALAQRIRDAISANRPEDEDELLHTDPTVQAQNAGATVTGSVESQSNEVSGAYDAMASPPSGSPTLSPTPVTPPESSSAGMGVSATSAAPDPIPAADTSLDADVAATNQRIADSGMETRVTAEIHDGPFQAARDANGELGELAQRTPEEIHAEEQTAIDSAQADMANLQLQAVAAMRAARAHTVGTTTDASGAMTGHEEVTRENVSQRAQTIYDQAQRDVQALLNPLTRTAMARWDAELTRHSREFHDALDSVQRWIDDRHSGVVGTIVAIGDYVGGLPAWVTREYNRAELQFGNSVSETLLSISSDVNAVIASAQAIIRQARDDINQLFDQMEAEFPEFVAAERARFGGMLDGLATQVADAQTNFVRDVSARAITAVNEAHAAVQAKREEAGGLIGRVVAAIAEFIDDPVRAIINGLLRLVHIEPSAFWALLAQIEQVIDDIANDPENFINNLTAGVKQGFQQFFDNFGMHLLRAFWNWLFSGLQTPIPMPTSFDPLSLVTFALQLMGITWPNVREILVRHLGPEAVELLEIAWNIISVLINEGPQGLVNMIKDQLSPENIVGMILDAAIDFIVEKLIVKAAEYIFSLLNPAGAIAQAVMLIYRVCRWIFQNAARIFAFVQAVVGGMANVVAGNIGGLAAVVERALASMLVVVIDLFMGLLGLGDLPDEVAEVIVALQTRVLQVIDRVVAFLVTQARALLRRMGIGGEDQPGEGHDDNELGKTVRFRGGGESHRLFVQPQGGDAEIMLASTPAPVTAKIREWRRMLDQNPPAVAQGTPEEARAKLATLETDVASLKADAAQLAEAFTTAAASTEDDTHPPDDTAIESKEDSVASQLSDLYRIFGQQDEQEIVAAIRTKLQSLSANWSGAADGALSPKFTSVKYVPKDQSQEADLFADRSAAVTAATSAAERVANDPDTQLRLVPWFRDPVRPATAADSAEFESAMFTFGPQRSRAGYRIRKAFGDAYVDYLAAQGTAVVDPVDEWMLGELRRTGWSPDSTTAGEITRAPRPLQQTDPALLRRARGRIVPFLRTMAASSEVDSYGIARFTWAWDHEQSHGYITGAFRDARLRGASGGYHEWIPTNYIPEVLTHAIATASASEAGVRTAVQWINVQHHLRSDTSKVFYRVTATPSADEVAARLYQGGTAVHPGGAWREAEGPRGAGAMASDRFHDALRNAFPAPGDLETTPEAFVHRLAEVVDPLLWNGDLSAAGAPSDIWDEPVGLWFQFTRGEERNGRMTLRALAARQRDNVLAIGNDFLSTLDNLNEGAG
jgi:hypothetical protein